jgi:hypothetical protein
MMMMRTKKMRKMNGKELKDHSERGGFFMSKLHCKKITIWIRDIVWLWYYIRGSQRLFPDDLLNQDGKNKLKKNIK